MFTGRPDRLNQPADASTPPSSSGRLSRILRQAVIELQPVHLFANPDVLGRCKRVAVVEGRERDAGRCAVPAPGKQPRAAGLAEDAIEYIRRRITRGVANHRERPLVEKRAGKEWRSRRLLALAAMTDANIDRLAFGLQADRATQASTFPGHEFPPICEQYYPQFLSSDTWKRQLAVSSMQSLKVLLPRIQT